MVFGYYSRFVFDVLPYFLVAGVLLAEQRYSVVASQMSCGRTSRTLPAVARRDEVRYFTNTWAVRILGGVGEARKVAKSVGQHFYMKVSNNLPNIYLLRHPRFPEKMNHSSEFVTERLKTNLKVSWAEQQVGEVRVTRRHTMKTARRVTEPKLSWPNTADAFVCPDPQNPHDDRKRALNLNDPFWPRQYYIKDCRQDHDGSPKDLNLAPVWIKHGLLGKNIRVMVVDDGVETKHADLVDNYDRTLGLDLQDNDGSPDPVHTFRKKYSHGTRCAGIIGMRGNNTICGIGIAPLVTLGAVRLLGPKLSSDYKICSALLFGLTKVHVVSNAWGPNDDGKTMPPLGHLTVTALKLGISKGRKGLGLLHVFGAGNGKEAGDYCGCDALVSSIYTVTVASCDHDGKLTTFSERCASVMVTAFTGTAKYNVVAADVGGDKCTTDMTGTSASMAMVSGALALALEANPALSWRDVQHLLAWTSQVAPLQHNPAGTWIRNAAGFYVSHDFGFGLLNINYLIEGAKRFRSVGALHTCTTGVTFNGGGQTFRNRVKVEINASGCEGSPSEVKRLEHVQLTVSLEFPKRGDLQIMLTSPSGTNVTLLDRRPRDSNQFGIQSWTFDSVLTWGEVPRGRWAVHIIGEKRKRINARPRSPLKKFWSFVKNKQDENMCHSSCPDHADEPDDAVHIGELTRLSLTFYGTSADQEPDHYKGGPRSYDAFKLLS